MVDGIQIKVCGLTSLVDAEFADACGVDYIGFNLYPKSPRYVSLAQYRAMAKRLPGRYTVAVKVIDIFGNDTMTLVPVNVG